MMKCLSVDWVGASSLSREVELDCWLNLINGCKSRLSWKHQWLNQRIEVSINELRLKYDHSYAIEHERALSEME